MKAVALHDSLREALQRLDAGRASALARAMDGLDFAAAGELCEALAGCAQA
ncbi:hypothetical protein [Solimonas soli]|uniref:hypothetical protein n=1 Tax=Solimonas soli TaxID=413479 RepID=UPI0004BB0594|nr:hypothetical protein [Solimonas soli]